MQKTKGISIGIKSTYADAITPILPSIIALRTQQRPGCQSRNPDPGFKWDKYLRFLGNPNISLWYKENFKTVSNTGCKIQEMRNQIVLSLKNLSGTLFSSSMPASQEVAETFFDDLQISFTVSSSYVKNRRLRNQIQRVMGISDFRLTKLSLDPYMCVFHSS